MAWVDSSYIICMRISVFVQRRTHQTLYTPSMHPTHWSAVRHPTPTDRQFGTPLISLDPKISRVEEGDGREKKKYWMQKLEWKGEFLCMYMQGNKKISWWMRRKGQGMVMERADKRSMFACKAFLSSISQMYAPAPAPYLILTLLPTWDLFWVKI